jgi:hypothetical protein
MAMLTQKTVRLYVDMDRGAYWPMILDGNQEKVPTDPTWSTPLNLPESVRFQISRGRGKRIRSVDLFFYPQEGSIRPRSIW